MNHDGLNSLKKEKTSVMPLMERNEIMNLDRSALASGIK